MSEPQQLDTTLELRGDAVSRQEQLSAAVRAIGRRAGGSDPPRRLLVVGGLMTGLGFLCILLGWSGAAHTTRLFEQIPYAISGGMLGTALVFAGGFCYFAFWITRLLQATQADNAEVRAALERIEQLLTPATNGSQQQTVPDRAAGYVATPSGTMYHRPDCLLVAGRDKLRTVNGTEAGLTPCRVCEPAPPARTPRSRRRSG